MTATEIPVSPPRVRRPTVTFGPFTFDPDNHLLRRGADEIRDESDGGGQTLSGQRNLARTAADAE